MRELQYHSATSNLVSLVTSLSAPATPEAYVSTAHGLHSSNSSEEEGNGDFPLIVLHQLGARVQFIYPVEGVGLQRARRAKGARSIEQTLAGHCSRDFFGAGCVTAGARYTARSCCGCSRGSMSKHLNHAPSNDERFSTAQQSSTQSLNALDVRAIAGRTDSPGRQHVPMQMIMSIITTLARSCRPSQKNKFRCVPLRA